MMSSIRGVLIDLSGTLHIGNTACEGAVEGLKKLRRAGVPFRFCTNTTKESANSIYQKLKALDFEVYKQEIFTSLIAARELILSSNLNPLLFLEDSALEDFQGIQTGQPNDSVVIGLSPSNFDYKTLNKAFRILIQNPKAPLIAIHKAKYFAEVDGLSLGPGPFVVALEHASGRNSITVGKPEKSFYEIAINDMGLLKDCNKVLIIGDDITQDLGGGAKELGLIRYLVKTGKYRAGDEKLDETIDGAFDNFGQAVEVILKRLREESKDQVRL